MGTLINAGGVFIASIFGLLLKTKLSKNMTDQLKSTMGLVLLVLSFGWFLSDFFVIQDNVIQTRFDLEILLMMMFGIVIGTLLRIDTSFNHLIERIEKKYKLPPVAEGFITASLIFCVGAIAIIGVFNEVIEGDLTLLLVKTTLDVVTAMILASTLGFGVIFSSISVLIYQGSIMLLASFFAPVMPETLVLYISLLGNMMIVAIALDFLNIKSFKVLNMLPAIIIAIVYVVLS
ncbi:MAG: DUF554 domain-containing protein [Acholeplasmataceae bacterium]